MDIVNRVRTEICVMNFIDISICQLSLVYMLGKEEAEVEPMMMTVGPSCCNFLDLKCKQLWYGWVIVPKTRDMYIHHRGVPLLLLVVSTQKLSTMLIVLWP